MILLILIWVNLIYPVSTWRASTQHRNFTSLNLSHQQKTISALGNLGMREDQHLRCRRKRIILRWKGENWTKDSSITLELKLNPILQTQLSISQIQQTQNQNQYWIKNQDTSKNQGRDPNRTLYCPSHNLNWISGRNAPGLSRKSIKILWTQFKAISAHLQPINIRNLETERIYRQPCRSRRASP